MDRPFATNSRRLLANISPQRSRTVRDSFRVGMNVPIFYDPQSPKKQLALCGSFYEVVLPDENITLECEAKALPWAG